MSVGPSGDVESDRGDSVSAALQQEIDRVEDEVRVFASTGGGHLSTAALDSIMRKVSAAMTTRQLRPHHGPSYTMSMLVILAAAPTHESAINAEVSFGAVGGEQ